MDKKGYLGLVLHSHLPYVLSHGRWPHGSDWLFEAASETYIPLIQQIEFMRKNGIDFHFTIGLTPVLLEQMAEPEFARGFRDYLRQKMLAAKDDKKFFDKTGQESKSRLAEMWLGLYQNIIWDFEILCQEDIASVFRDFQDEGYIEVITSAATHGYLPLLGTDNSVYAQIEIGRRVYEKYFGRQPRGIWLPEAAYRPRYNWCYPVEGFSKKEFTRRGIEEFLHSTGIEYFIVDSHLLKGGEARGVYIDRFEALKRLWVQFAEGYKPRPRAEELTEYRPYIIGSGGTAVFVRDPKTGLQVWSGEWGYPGNPAYLEFHKKRFPGGHRYWRVTDSKADLAEKDEYHPEWIEDTLVEQAAHFAKLSRDILLKEYEKLGIPAVITAPYDTELFGHWWFEGTRWLTKVMQELLNDKAIGSTTLSSYLDKFPPVEVVSLPEGSWGQGGFHYIWLNEWTEWTWRHIYEAEQKMVELANRYKDNVDETKERVLNQLAVELLLLESSDWQFLISTWSARDYAESRVSFHYDRFKELVVLLSRLEQNGGLSDAEAEFLQNISQQDKPFSGIVDFRLWSDETLEKNVPL
ncbi:DUF1957 domain-containing protein [bacterium]|nr:DUF1957 domain-containing protein [bacterium]